jgi:hypothetical protein
MVIQPTSPSAGFMKRITQFDLALQTREAEGVLGPPKQYLPEHPIHQSDGDGRTSFIPTQTPTGDLMAQWTITFTQNPSTLTSI